MSEPRTDPSSRRVAVLGAGPAGLTAAYRLLGRGVPSVVIEKSEIVGGISRTEQYEGFRFDMGGHRFFTKVKEVKAMWREVLGTEFLRRGRLSRIYFRRRFFDYPLKPLNALFGLGLVEATLCVLSYVRWQIFPHKVEESFEQWVTNRFGLRLFRTFFESYTEKVWGIPCSELKAEWAAQRIKDLSLRTAVLNMVLKPRRTIKTLIEEFDYPRHGPGMMWNAVRERVEAGGCEVRMRSEVVRLHREGARVVAVTVRRDGIDERLPVTDVISTMALSELVARTDPPPPAPLLEASRRLGYRDFLTVCLIIRQPDLFPDNWIYVQDPDVTVGRIQNFKNWSPDMVPDPSRSSLGLEYFCYEGDALWRKSDAELVELGKRELEHIGLAAAADVEDGCVFRVPKAYPVYDSAYGEVMGELRAFVDGFENLWTVGRNGLHRYNNQDHAMLTGMLAVENLLDGAKHDLWAVNTEAEYHEEEVEDVLEPAIAEIEATFARLDRSAFGIACGAVAALGMLAATLFLVVRGGETVGPHLSLLAQYFPGYRVTVAGAFVGAAYAFTAGYVGGWGFALSKNLIAFLYLTLFRRRAQWERLRRLLEYV